MKMLKKIMLAAVLALPSMAMAAPYLIAGAVSGTADLEDVEATYPATPGLSFNSDDSFTRALFGVGTNVNENLSLEALYLTEAEVTVEESMASAKDTVQSSGLQFALLGKAPLTPQFSLLGKLSLNYVKVEYEFEDPFGFWGGSFSEDDTSMQLGFGVGAHFQASDAIGLRLGFERIQLREAIGGTGDSDIDQASLAVTFSF
jgi:opacity protein-like surface antigen